MAWAGKSAAVYRRNIPAGFGTRFEYDALGLTVAKTTRQLSDPINPDQPINHEVYTVQDFATGATLLTAGPNAVMVDGAPVYARQRTKVDGLGRPLEQYVSVDDDTLGYREELVAKYVYIDSHDEGIPSPAVIEERLVGGRSTFAKTMIRFDGLGREVYQRVYSDETDDAETYYHWNEKRQLSQIDVPNPRTERRAAELPF